jgi:hypothetical protein
MVMPPFKMIRRHRNRDLSSTGMKEGKKEERKRERKTERQKERGN